MRYVIDSGSFQEVPLTSGTVQNTGNVPIEISDTETFRSGIILNPGEKFSWDNATLYARVTYLEKEGVLAVVPFKKAAGGGGGSEYVLPVATASRLGGVKSSNAAGAISISPTGIMTYNAPSVEPLSAPEWEPNTTYPVNALVEYNNNVYMCLVNHTSGLFIDDLDYGYWKLIGVSIPTATEMKLGGVRSSSDEGKVTVQSDGTMSVNFPEMSVPEWVTNKAYKVNAIVKNDGNLYVCLVNHTSGVFADDLADGKWKIISESSGVDLPEWQANTQYKAGKYLVHKGTVYKVDNDFTSGTTFSDTNLTSYIAPIMEGATSSTNGNSGLVPPPTTSDISKFLCGDGTWKSAGGSGEYVNKDVLFSGNIFIAENAIINLTRPYTDYDYLLIEKIDSGYFCVTVEISEITTRTILFPCKNSSVDYTMLNSLSTTQLEMVNVGNITGTSAIYRITGVKFLPNPNNYSTTEQEIGTWIDGKKLYQITFTGTTGSGNIGAAIDCTALGIDKCVDISGYIMNTNGGFFPVNYNNNNNYVSTSFGADKTIYLSNSNIFSNCSYSITIKYTKA